MLSRSQCLKRRVGDKLEGLAKPVLFVCKIYDIMTEIIRHVIVSAIHLKGSRNMIEVLFGSKNAERVLIYIHTRQEGYAREIARFYNTDLKSIQNQLDKMEAGGVLVRREVGRTRPYTFNPGYSLLNELKGLLEKAFSFYPMQIQEELVMNRVGLNTANKSL